MSFGLSEGSSINYDIRTIYCGRGGEVTRDMVQVGLPRTTMCAYTIKLFRNNKRVREHARKSRGNSL